MAMSGEFRARIERILTPVDGPVAASDRRCNMLSFNTAIHRIWGKAYFGLKWHGRMDSVASAASDMTKVLVEVHWLPESISKSVEDAQLVSEDDQAVQARRRVQPDSAHDIDRVAESLRRTILNPSKWSCRDSWIRAGAGRLWESGRLLEIDMATRDVKDFKSIIEAQWLMIRIAALSGASGDNLPRFQRGPTPPPPLVLASPVTEDE